MTLKTVWASLVGVGLVAVVRRWRFSYVEASVCVSPNLRRS
ncbi:MAG: hypothetical protein VST64_08760 [Nitrospirota bacterium]|nr:hypothetical protein [Nitrospirota bacterium]